MTTTPRRWPNNASAARLDGIALTTKAIGELTPVLKNIERMSPVEILQRVAQAIIACQETREKLKEVG